MITKRLIKIFGVAGAGKTRECTNLIQEFLKEGYDMNQIACVSFSRECIYNIIERLKELNIYLPHKREHYFRTLNSITWQICGFQETIKEYEVDKFFTNNGINIQSDNDETKSEKQLIIDAYSVVRNALGNNIINCDQNKAFGIIEDYLQENISEENYLDSQSVLKICCKYEQWKNDNNVHDHDDSLIETLKKQYNIGNNTKILIIDEAQDLGYLQQEIINLWTKKHDKDIVVFAGDDDQTIHAWRGASAKFLLNYSSDSCKTEKIILETSWRLPEKIAYFCNDILNTINEREKKIIRPIKRNGQFSYVNEDNFFGSLQQNFENNKKIFILCRTNKIRRELADILFSNYNIPFNFFKPDTQSKWSNKFIAVNNALNKLKKKNDLLKYEAKQLFGVLPANCLIRGIKTQFCDLNDKDMNIQHTISSQEFLSMTKHWAAQKSLTTSHFYKDIKASIIKYISWITEKDKKSIETNETYRTRLLSLDRIFDLSKNEDGKWFFDSGIKLGTFHDSKGREADTVFVLLGTSFAFRTIDDNERRVFYVACSRAKETLVLVECFLSNHRDCLEDEFSFIINKNTKTSA